MKKNIILAVIPLAALLLALLGVWRLPEYSTALIITAMGICLVCNALNWDWINTPEESRDADHERRIQKLESKQREIERELAELKGLDAQGQTATGNEVKNMTHHCV